MINKMNQVIKPAFHEYISLRSVFRGIFFAYIITVPAFILFAAALTYTDFPEKLISPVIVLTTMASVLFAGAVSTKEIKNRGWLNGSIVGFIYLLVLYMLSSVIFNDFSVDKYVVLMTILSILAGAIGGIVGINTRGRKRIRVKRL